MCITFHLPALSGDGTYRLMYTVLEHSATGNKTETSVPSSTPQEQWNVSWWSINISWWSMKQRVVPGECFEHFCHRTLLPFWPRVHLPPCFGRRDRTVQAPHGEYLGNGCMGQTGTEHPDCCITPQPSTLLQYPGFKSDRSGFDSQWAVPCFSVAN